MKPIGPKDGERADFPNLGNRFILRGRDTAGQFALIEHEIKPRSLAAPTHTHRREDEYSYILTGRMGFHLDGEEGEAGPGELVAKPRGTPHAFWNPGDEPTRLLELISPAGFESYFEELAPHLAGAGPPDREALAAIQRRYELTMDMASRAALVEKHGLEG